MRNQCAPGPAWAAGGRPDRRVGETFVLSITATKGPGDRLGNRLACPGDCTNDHGLTRSEGPIGDARSYSIIGGA